MKILFITHQYLPHHIGGTELLVHGLAKHWQGRGRNCQSAVLTYVEAATANFHQYGLRESAYDGVPITEVHFNLSQATHLAEAEYFFPMMAQLVKQVVRKIEPQLVHVAHALKYSAAILPMLKSMGIPTVMTLSDFWPICLRHTLLRWDQTLCSTGPLPALACLRCAKATHGYPAGLEKIADGDLSVEGIANLGDERLTRDVRALENRLGTLRSALLSADRLVALSAFAKEIFVKNGYPVARLSVMEHGVDASQLAAGRALRKQQLLPEVPLRLAFIATLAPHKGLHILLAALRLIPDFPVQLDVYGPDGGGSYAHDLRRQAAGDSRVRFHGAIPPTEVGEKLASAHALAMPAQWYENDPLIVKSAFYVGVPVVASRLGSLEEMLTRTGFGWLLPADDAAAWADWISLLATPAAFAALPAPPTTATSATFAEEMFSLYDSLLTADAIPLLA